MAELIVKLGDQVLQTRALKGDLLRVGRSRENDIILENLSVSRNHLQIRKHQGRYLIIDLSSANGTYLNGTRVTKKDLMDGDQIKVGKHMLIFQDLAQQSTVLDLPPDAGASSPPASPLKSPTPDGRANAWLTVESGRLKGRDFKVVRFETSLGKAPSNDVVLTDDWLISKKQAIIIRKGNDEFEIQDLGGLRKLKVNGDAVEDKVELKSGDVVEIGGTRLVFHSDAPSRNQTPTARKRGPKLVPTGKNRSLTPVPEASEGSAKLARVALVNGNGNSPGNAATPTAAIKLSDVAAAQNYVNDSLDLEELFEAPPAEESSTPEDSMAGVMASALSNMAAVSESSAPVTPQRTSVSSAARVSDLPVEKSGGANDKEVEMWESALNSQSAAIRRQAARMLKKLTGRDYDA